ncbi:hypothetical protein [Streptosporangium minutum]|nr:hypothetical protein [Streptosporangium minutum]
MRPARHLLNARSCGLRNIGEDEETGHVPTELLRPVAEADEPGGVVTR